MGTETTSKLYRDYAQRPGERLGLFTSLAGSFPIDRVLYPGSYVHLAPSFVFRSVVYVDTDRRAKRFFADRPLVELLVSERKRYAGAFDVMFRHADYTSDLAEPEESFDLLVSLWAGFVSQACKRYLRVGGWLLVNNSHGDAGMASIDPDFELVAVVDARAGKYELTTSALDDCFIPARAVEVTRELLTRTGRGVAYTRSPAAYVFQRRS